MKYLSQTEDVNIVTVDDLIKVLERFQGRQVFTDGGRTLKIQSIVDVNISDDGRFIVLDCIDYDKVVK